MSDPNQEDLATLWWLPTGACCIISCRGGDWHVRVEQDGVTVRQYLLPNSRSAMALASEWEEEFKTVRAAGAISASI